MIVERRQRVVPAPPDAVFAEIERVGGAGGWPYANVLWRVRGLIDRAVGGVGMRLRRRDPGTAPGRATLWTSGASRRSTGRPCCACGRR